ncbi:MAG: transposase [Candidatus Omnitrophica bacterium CG07_land_8_20_14_0_80_50_8]|nr:MAG: hypothetical protein AUJ71_03185 [Candidatus Omnitrophica bacterium CG1_02_49_16]PIU40590.1 MAG: transposase [Candidatus Omnitrophica bacterium CG07_land_8_20_14_0_80_50_8]
MTKPYLIQSNRRSMRLKEYDYSQCGMYFVTLCTYQGECLFGEIVDGHMRLNRLGQIANKCWNDIPHHFSHIELDMFCVMPNHMHAVVNCRGTACRAPTGERFGKPVYGSIPTVIRSYKSVVTKRVNELGRSPGRPIWQSNYYEHIIRNDKSLDEIREYIAHNPARWELDSENEGRATRR